MSLLITGVIDGPLSGGVPKAIEITVLSDIADLSIYGIESANNGNAAAGAEFTFPAISASAGDTIYVASETDGFTDFFGFAPDYTDSALSINGDDAIILYENGTILDVFGDVGTDGTGTAWDHVDGWAYRNDSVSGPSAVFDTTEWTFSGTNALDGETSNATAATPFPAGSYAGGGGTTGPVVFAREDFDNGDLNLISGFDPATGNLDGGGGDFFGVGNLGAWPQGTGVPFSLADDSVADISGGGVFTADAEGIFGQNRDAADDFFALSDSDEFNEAQTASWTFDILGYEDLMLAIDMGGISDSSFGGYSADTSVVFTVSVDGGAEQTAFTLTQTEDGTYTTRLNDAGGATGGGALLAVSGDAAVTKLLAEDGTEATDTYLDKATTDTGALDTFLTSLDGTGSTLTLTLTADLPFEAMAFDNIEISGTEAPVTGSVFSIEADVASLPEGDEGVSNYTFTVTRAGDSSGVASVSYAVSGADVEGADFGGVLPSGIVEFADGETSKTITIPIMGDDIIEEDEDFTVTLSDPVNGTIAVASADGRIANDDLEVTLISEIQGNAATWGEQFGRTDATPFFGATVLVEAVVVGDFQDFDADEGSNLGGFYLQEEDADSDADATTSEGIFVWEGDMDIDIDVSIGDKVMVVGTATEYFGETQITATEIVVVSSDEPMPTAAEITFPIAETLVNGDGQIIADLEAYEGMLVHIDQDMTVADLFDYGRYGEIGLYADGVLETYTQSNDPDVDGFAEYVENAVSNTVTINDGLSSQNPFDLDYPDGAYGTMDGLSSGDTMTDITGVVSYSRSSGSSGDENYRINTTELPEFEDTNPREETPPDVGGSLKVASFNVLNYFNGDGNGGGFPTERGADTLEEFERQQEKLVAAITEIDADVVGLVELENDGYGPDSAIASLVDALNAELGAEVYAFVDPGVDTLGDDAIAVGFIYKVDSVQVVGDVAILDNTVDARFDSDNQRPSLAVTFEELESGETFTSVVNHFKSKGSPVEGTEGDEDARDGAGNANATRTNAAEALADWLATDPTGIGDDDVLIIGDLNAYAQEDPIKALLEGADDVLGTGDDFTNLTEGQLSYGFPVDLDTAGQVQAFGTLDYALSSGAMTEQVTGAEVWNINSDEPAFIDYNTEFKPDNPDIYSPDAFRSSDHDPVIIGLDLGPDTVLARVDIDPLRRWNSEAVFSLDGEEQGATKISGYSKSIKLDEAGVKISADDGINWGWEYIVAKNGALGIKSLSGDWRNGRDSKLIDDEETLIFTLNDDSGLGEARDASFEFAKVKGDGQVELTFYSDGELVDQVLLDVADGAVYYDLAGTVEFDKVALGVTDTLKLSVDAFEFERTLLDDPLLA